MPLHLLGKKSWNVYNKSNIERVQRDEAAAAERERIAKQHETEQNTLRRLAILRGEDVPALPSPPVAEEDAQHRDARSAEIRSVNRKRRRLPGEDDTDRDIRNAREIAQHDRRDRKIAAPTRENDSPIVDGKGHIQLITPTTDKRPSTVLQKQSNDDEQGMRFSDACGYRNHHSSKPWYAGQTHSDKRIDDSTTLSAVVEKDVWGNEDPRRKERESVRLTSSDPFAVMQSAQNQLKRSQRDREEWDKQRQTKLDSDVSRPRTRTAREGHGKHRHSHHADHRHDRRHHRSHDEHRDRHERLKRQRENT